MGDTPIQGIFQILRTRSSTVLSLIYDLQQDLPIVRISFLVLHLLNHVQIIFAVLSMLNGPGLTMTSLLMLQQMDATINATAWQLYHETRNMQEHLQVIKNIYTLCDIENKVKSGDQPYPDPAVVVEKERLEGNGAKIEFK